MSLRHENMVSPGTVLNIIGYDARLLLLSLTLATAIPSCCPCRHLPTHTETTVKDSTAVHNHDSHSVVDSTSVRDSTIHAPLPVENSQNILPAILPSHLETSLAVSDAYVDSLGLHHTLRNKEDSLAVTVPVVEHYHYESHNQQSDSTSVHSDSEKETVTEYVEKPPTWWQKFRLGAFWWLVSALAAALVWIFRKPILKLIRLW